MRGFERHNSPFVILYVVQSLNVSVFFSFVCNKDEEGRSGPFVDKIREQEKIEKTIYIKEIENALGGNR